MDHIRIDEGTTRGKYPQRSNGLERNAKGQFIPILPQDDASIAKAIESYRDGATCEQIAAQHGVSLQAIYSWLLGDLGGPEREKLITQALTARIAKADDNLDSAPNPLELARAREQARNSRTDLERRRPRLYGQQRQDININTEGPVTVQVVSFAAQQMPEIAQETGSIEVKP